MSQQPISKNVKTLYALLQRYLASSNINFSCNYAATLQTHEYTNVETLNSASRPNNAEIITIIEQFVIHNSTFRTLSWQQIFNINKMKEKEYD